MFFPGGTVQPERLSPETQIALCLKVHFEDDEEAWERLCKSFWLAVVGCISARIPDKRNAMDYAQEVFIRAYRNLTYCPYDSKLTFYGLLYRIARNVLSERPRKIREYLATDLARFSDEGNEWDFMNTLVDPKTLEDPEPPGENGNGEDAVVWLEFFRLVLLCCAKPHQLLSFGFTQLLEWKPGRFVDKRSSATLGDLGEEFFREYFDTCNAFYEQESDQPFMDRHEFYRDYCYPLVEKLDGPVEAVYSEPSYRRLPPGTVRERRFEEFYTAKCLTDPEKCLYNWSYKVKLKAQRTIAAQSVCAEPKAGRPVARGKSAALGTKTKGARPGNKGTDR